jgi:hypothetical protein
MYDFCASMLSVFMFRVNASSIDGLVRGRARCFTENDVYFSSCGAVFSYFMNMRMDIRILLIEC